MSAIEKLKAEVADLGVSVAAAVSTIKAEADKISAAVLDGDVDAIESAVTQIHAASEALKAAVAAVQPAPAPAADAPVDPAPVSAEDPAGQN